MTDTEYKQNESRSMAGAFAWLLPVGLVVLVLGLAWAAVFVIMNDLVHAAFVQDTTYESTEK
jgi:predicted acyltransferase